jgi:hypothetical protein
MRDELRADDADFDFPAHGVVGWNFESLDEQRHSG